MHTTNDTTNVSIGPARGDERLEVHLVTSERRPHEVFLGRRSPAPAEACVGGALELQGKVLSLRPGGGLAVRPFHTRVVLAPEEEGVVVLALGSQRARQEAERVLRGGETVLSRDAVPHLARWVAAALESAEAERARAGGGEAGELAARADGAAFPTLLASFVTTAQEFRRALFQARQVESQRELDQVVELEGNLWIELGRVTNRAAVRLNGLLQRERDLAAHLEELARLGSGVEIGTSGGWPFFEERLEAAKSWARSRGRRDVLEELHAILRDGAQGVGDVLLDHAQVLDTLIADTFAQYGVQHPEPAYGDGVLQPRRRARPPREARSSSSVY